MIYIFCLGFPLVMLAMFFVINKFTGGNTPIFEIHALVPGIIVFSYSFVMLMLALVVSKDRQTCFLKRLYASPMKSYQFILGYACVGLVIGLLQTAVCISAGWIIALVGGVSYLSFGAILLLIVSQLPMLIINVGLGILFGTVFNDKAAPGICSVLISLEGMFGGCWMPVETMGDFATFCRVLPFYPSVYWGRVITGASNAFGTTYIFDQVAVLGFIPIGVLMIASVVLCIMAFKRTMVSDK